MRRKKMKIFNKNILFKTKFPKKNYPNLTKRKMNFSINLLENSTIIYSIDPNNLFEYIGYLYIIPIMCSVGFVLNIISLAVFLNIKVKLTINRLYVIKSILDASFLCMGALTPIINCINCSTSQTYGAKIYKHYFIIYLTQVVYSSTAFMEIVITFNRFRN